nr:hypothetical protein [Sahlingia subintegra]
MVTIKKINNNHSETAEIYCLISQLITNCKIHCYIIGLIRIEYHTNSYIIYQIENYIGQMKNKYNVGGICMLYYVTLLYIKKTVFLMLEISTSNFKALKLYYYYGFQANNKRLKYYQKNNANCFLMTNTKSFTYNCIYQRALISILKQ